MKLSSSTIRRTRLKTYLFNMFFFDLINRVIEKKDIEWYNKISEVYKNEETESKYKEN